MEIVAGIAGFFALYVLVRFAIFAAVLVAEHAEVALITALGDIVILEGLQHGTTRLMGMGAVGEAAVLGETEYLTEIAGKLLGLHIERAEALDARCVDEPAAADGDHLGEGGGMLARIVGIRDVCRAEVHARHKTVDERGLTHPAVAAEQRDAVGEQRAQRVDPLARGGRDLAALIAHGLVERDEHPEVAALVVVVEIGLIK